MKSQFTRDVQIELFRARRLHEPQHSVHEGYAIMLEEVREVEQEVFKKTAARSSSNLYNELVQVAAMAQRMAEDNELERKT